MKPAILSAIFATTFLAAGCPAPPSAPPVSPAQYRKMSHRRESYPKQVILMHNLQRVFDADLETAQRVDSFALVAMIGSDDPQVAGQLASVLADERTPEQLHRKVLAFLLKSDYPGLAAHVVPVVAQAGRDSDLREAILGWLARHPTPAVLAEVVKLWAAEPSITGPNEPRYRGIVENISGRSWDETLLGSINTPVFFARGSALEVLAARMPAAVLRFRISQLVAKTDACKALQAFIDRFEYVPTTRADFLATVSIHKTRPEMLSDAVRLSTAWTEDYGLKFNIRDFHLLSRLARDPLRTNLRRTQLVLEISRAFSSRTHTHGRPAGSEARGDYNDDFGSQVDRLTMSDLWNLYLLNEMLSRPRIQMALGIMAERDRADRRGAWGGLVFYENGQAEAKLYQGSRQSGENDLAYSPAKRFMIDARDSLCRFHGHFEKLDNSARAGPDAAELSDAKNGNYYGLILTSLLGDAFCAHYYNPSGCVISMGQFLFRR